jgi:two-component system nitrogen regulation response regulator NtrX
MKRAVVVEDDPRVRAAVVAELRDEGLEVEAFGRAEDAQTALRCGACLLLVDVRLPGQSGVELIQALASAGTLPTTIVISGEATISETVEGLRAGVYDFIEKPFSRERLRTSVRNALARADLEREVVSLRSALGGSQAILGDSPAIVELRERIARAAAVDATVLIRGESGTGKELVAAAVHGQSARKNGPFIKLNCAAITSSLVEDELFGHARGAFTGANASKAGLFEEANGGILFLDEIGDMELELQTRLLRVLEDGRVRRLGETRDRAVDVRVVAATNQSLEELVQEHRFRQDLYFRLAHLQLDVPPLRQRTGDVRLLTQHFLTAFCQRHRKPPRTITEDALAALERAGFAGNVRELRNLCERLVVFGGEPITVDQLPPELRGASGAGQPPLLRLAELAPDVTLRDLRQACEREYIEYVLARCDWNVTAAARILGVQRTHLHDKLTALGLRRPE